MEKNKKKMTWAAQSANIPLLIDKNIVKFFVMKVLFVAD